MRTLAPRERRLSAIALLTFTLVLGWVLIVAPIVRGFEDRAERRRELLSAYARDERALAQVASIGRAAAAQRGRAGLFRMAAADQPAAAAMLAERLAAEVARAGGEMRGVEDLGGPPGIARARVQAAMALPQAVALIARLEDTPPLLLVDAADLVAHDAADEPTARPLDVRLEVSAAFSSTTPR
ncbi:type II secretion system protein GspM [Sphingomonas sp.]|uniref:type II secretion system protein GspM n=1 Tax=Sphingomonas sp. TaxID=28214 RepID=UPI003B00813E